MRSSAQIVGVVLMVGGNIPGRTKVISIAIYEHVETLNYAEAHLLSAGLLLFSFAVLFVLYAYVRGRGVSPGQSHARAGA